MKTSAKIILSMVMAISAVATTSAQTFETFYFLDNYSYAHRINPAFQSNTNVLGIALSNINIGAGSNVGVSDILFPRNGQLVSGLNSAVSQTEFLSKLPAMTSVSEDFSMNLLTVGFWNGSKTSYHTIEINLREFTAAAIPYGIPAFLKKGGEDLYDLSGTDSDLRCFIDVTYGFSREINDRIKIGGRLHGLVGALGAEAGTQSLAIQTSKSNILVNGFGILRIAQPAFTVELNQDGYYNLDRINTGGTPGIAGFGAAVDLGVSVEAYEGLEASFAVTDLGGILWKYNICGKTTGEVNASSINDVQSNADDLLKDLGKFKPEATTNLFEMLPLNINAGVRYKMPFYSGLSAGVFATYKHYKGTNCLNARLGATISPAKWFSFTANCGYGSFGGTAGAAMSITGGALNLFVGAETFLGKTMSDYPLPVGKFKLALDFGLTFRFGGKQI